MNVDAQGWLTYVAGEPPVIRYGTPRTSPLAVPHPLGIVWHWTAGRGGTSGWSSALAKSIQSYDAKTDRAASWHVLIGKDGTIHQSAPFLVGTWHVGRPGTIGNVSNPNVNKLSIGCELENAGRLLKFGSKFFCWPFYIDPDAGPHRQLDPHLEVDPARAVLGEAGCWPGAEGGFFDAYTSAQETSAELMLHALVSAFAWGPAVCGYGHIQFDFPRREDPGPLWLKGALPRILDKVFPARVCGAAP